MGARISSHEIDERGTSFVKNQIANLPNDHAVFRELTGRDYGIDGIIELFEREYATGEIAMIQIKSTNNRIPIQKKDSCVAIDISKSSAYYTFQNRIPFVLIYCSVKEKKAYYKILNETLTEQDRKTLSIKKKIQIRIPSENVLSSDFTACVIDIRGFYK